MIFSKEHLTGLYKWTVDKKNESFEGEPTRRLFDRYNGQQVLFIINLVMQSISNFSMEQGKNLERLIINKLSFDPCSELTVFNWLQKEIKVEAC
jgi:hypothetical protein